jgi:hypothetical protein
MILVHVAGEVRMFMLLSLCGLLGISLDENDASRELAIVRKRGPPKSGSMTGD